MFLDMSPDCLDRWLADYHEFHRALMLFVQPIAKGSGYNLEPDRVALQAAWAAWAAECGVWSNSYVMKNSNGLSHVKVLAILLKELAAVQWIKALYEFEIAGTSDERENEYNGTP